MRWMLLAGSNVDICSYKPLDYTDASAMSAELAASEGLITHEKVPCFYVCPHQVY